MRILPIEHKYAASLNIFINNGLLKRFTLDITQGEICGIKQIWDETTIVLDDSVKPYWIDSGKEKYIPCLYDENKKVLSLYTESIKDSIEEYCHMIIYGIFHVIYHYLLSQNKIVFKKKLYNSIVMESLAMYFTLGIEDRLCQGVNKKKDNTTSKIFSSIREKVLKRIEESNDYLPDSLRKLANYEKWPALLPKDDKEFVNILKTSINGKLRDCFEEALYVLFIYISINLDYIDFNAIMELDDIVINY